MLHEIKIKTSRPDRKGVNKEVREHYVCEAENFADAEVMGFALGAHPAETDVFAVFRSDIREIINSQEADTQPAWRAVVLDNYLDDNGNKKAIKYALLVFANDLNSATDIVTKHLAQGYDMELDSVKRTKIITFVTR